MSPDRLYAVGWRPVNAGATVPSMYLPSEAAELHQAGQEPRYVFSQAQANKIGLRIARDDRVGDVSIRSKAIKAPAEAAR